jgi:hypothetical protein
MARLLSSFLLLGLICSTGYIYSQANPPIYSEIIPTSSGLSTTNLSDDLLQDSNSVVAGSTSAQCTVRVAADEIVVSDAERREVAFHVQPAGVIPDPGQWPYFAWSDTYLGVVRSRDGSKYLFFGSDGGCHLNCNGKNSRGGSITVSTGTLDHPLGEPLGDPNPPVSEFLIPNSGNLPDYMNYVGGGPVYRVPEGEPGEGDLLIVYHVERPAHVFWSWLGLAKSSDEGQTWQDLGLIISGTHPYNPQGQLDIGDGDLVVATDPHTHQKYFYIYFGTDTTYLSAARAPYEELLSAIFMADPARMPATGRFHKYYNGAWNSSGLDGPASELFPTVTGQTDGDPQVNWSAYRNRFIAIEDNGQYIAYGESVDGLNWPPMQVILGKNPQTAVYGYATPVGIGEDPAILGSTFYVFYTSFPQGVSWQPATLNRLTVTTAASLKGIAPSSGAAGSAAFTLTVNGNHFVRDSKVLWNGSARATTYISINQLKAAILASDIENPGTARIEVSNPRPCGGISNVSVFSISAPADQHGN